MSDNDDEGAETSRVLINGEEQYCLWPVGKDVPDGWSTVYEGSRSDCLDYVERTWTDMRPKSLRDAIAASGDGSG